VGSAQDMLDLIGFDAVLERVENGDEIVHICKDYGVGIGSFYRFVRATPERAEQYTRALEASAEALLAKGRAVIESSLRRDSGIDPQAAKAYAQELSRLGGIRNKAYSDKPQVAVQINNVAQPLQLPDNLDPIAASRAYAALIEQK